MTIVVMADAGDCCGGVCAAVASPCYFVARNPPHPCRLKSAEVKNEAPITLQWPGVRVLTIDSTALKATHVVAVAAAWSATLESLQVSYGGRSLEVGGVRVCKRGWQSGENWLPDSVWRVGRLFNSALWLVTECHLAACSRKIADIPPFPPLFASHRSGNSVCLGASGPTTAPTNAFQTLARCRRCEGQR